MSKIAAVLALVLVLDASRADAQQEGVRWTVAAGPSMALRNGRLIPLGNPFSFTWNDPMITGAIDGKFNASVGLSAPVANSALRWRAELLFNQARSGPARYWRPCDPDSSPPVLTFCGGPRPALRDELYVLNGGLDWDAFPDRRWSVYLLTTLGYAHSRLHWSRDHTASRPDERTLSNGIAASAGIGYRFPLWQHEGFFEMRRLATSRVHSATFVPFSFGIRF